MAKFEVEKFDGQNSFSLWRIKIKALLRQQSLLKVLEVLVSEDSPAPSKEEEEKVHSTILLSLSDGVLREVADEETATGLWSALENLYMRYGLILLLIIRI